MIMEAEIGENAIGEEILTLTVQTATGENRQMILTFPHREGGNRSRVRDEWVRIIQQEVSAARGAAVRQAVAAPQNVPVKRSAQTRAYESPAPAGEDSVDPDSLNSLRRLLQRLRFDAITENENLFEYLSNCSVCLGQNLPFVTSCSDLIQRSLSCFESYASLVSRS